MRIILVTSLALFFLSSCMSKTEAPPPSPYPSIPMGVSAEILMPKVATWASYTARGTEPFWSVEVTLTTAVLARPSDTGIISTQFDTVQDDKWAIIVIKSIKGDFFLTLTRGECSDGMSDTKYSYNSTVNVGAEELRGCASVR